MPCNSGQGDAPYDSDAHRKADRAIAEADKVTRILCAILRSLPDTYIGTLGPEVRQWMDEHRARDEKEGRPWR